MHSGMFPYSVLLGSTVDTCLASVFEAFWKNFLLFSLFFSLGDDFRIVSVFSAELGSTADTCAASVYKLSGSVFFFLGDDFGFVSVLCA